jgi:methanogenic corrinoid protein MtbC1
MDNTRIHRASEEAVMSAQALKERLEFLSRELSSKHSEEAGAMDAAVTDGLEVHDQREKKIR